MKALFSQKLKKLRTENKFSQTTVATAVNVSVKTVSHWETGYSEPSIKQLVCLADLFDVSLDELVGRE